MCWWKSEYCRLQLPPTSRQREESELLLFKPVRVGLTWIVRHLAWWLLFLFVLYLGSGITIVQPDEVAVVYRFGQLRNAGTAQAVAQPGMLLALPKPFERVERIPVQKVFEQKVEDFTFERLDR